MKKRIVYLAGLISTEHPESLEWRLRVAPQFEAAGFEVRTPLKGKTNLKNETRDGGLTTTTTSNKCIVLRDYRDVSESDIILAHLETFGCPRPSCGTYCELAWSWTLRKPVIAIADEKNYVMRNHPFISEFVANYLPTEEEAVKFICRYYGNQP